MESEPASEIAHHPTHTPEHAATQRAAQDHAARLADFVMGKVYALAAVIYLIIALINFWPITTHITSAIAGYGGDGYQSLWGIWFVGYSLFTLHHGIWSTMLLFSPIGANLAFQTFSPIASLLVLPFTSVSLGFAYNILFFVGFFLSGLTMFILARYITKNSYAAFIAGLIFTFSTFHIGAYGHLDFANLEWIPLALYFFLRMVKEEHRRNLNGSGASQYRTIFACFMGDVQAGIILLFLLLIIGISIPCSKRRRGYVYSAGASSLRSQYS